MYEELYQNNRAILYAEAKRYVGFCEKDRAVSVEDLVQSGFIGLVEAARTYKEDSGKSWLFHAKWYIRREIYNALGIKSGKIKRVEYNATSIDKPLTEGDSDSDTLGDLLADTSLPESDAALLLEELQNSVWLAIEELDNPQQREIIKACIMRGKPISDVAIEIGISPSKVIQLYNRALSNMAKNIRIRSLAELDEATNFYAHKGVKAFMSSRSSVTEDAAFFRIAKRQKMGI